MRGTAAVSFSLRVSPSSPGKGAQMALMDCKECGRRVSSLATACPSCGAPQVPNPRVHLFWTAAVIILACVAGGVIALRDRSVYVPQPLDNREQLEQEKEATKNALHQSSSPSELNGALRYCLLPPARYGHHSSYDGGKSAYELLTEKCWKESSAWIGACEAQGNDEMSCLSKSLALAQVALKLFKK